MEELTQGMTQAIVPLDRPKQPEHEMSELQKTVRAAARRTNKIQRAINKRILAEAREEDRQRALKEKQRSSQQESAKATVS